MSDRINVSCRFCGKSLDDYKFFPPSCDCEEYKAAEAKRIEELKSEPGYAEQLSGDEYNKKYPIVFKGNREVNEIDSSHKVILEARQYPTGVGLVVSVPFEVEGVDVDGGLCWDFTNKDAEALYSLLREYLEGKNEYTEPC